MMALTQKQLNVWHAKRNKLGGISANENWNVLIGLPDPATRKILNRCYDHNFGILSGKVTMKMFKNYMENVHE